ARSFVGLSQRMQYRLSPTSTTMLSAPWVASSRLITVERATSFSREPCFSRRVRMGAGTPPVKRPTYEYIVPEPLDDHPSPGGTARVASSPLSGFRISMLPPLVDGRALGSVRLLGAVNSRRRWRAPESLSTSTEASSG